jgi:hypothetical protein
MPYRMILAVLLLTSISAYGQNTPGRYLPDGRWQARNMNATVIKPDSSMSDDFPIITSWGPDLRVTHRPSNTLCYLGPQVTTSDGQLLNIIYSDQPRTMLSLVQSFDGGMTWAEPQAFLPQDAYNAISQSGAVVGDYIYYVFHADWRGQAINMRRSTDAGQTWLPIQIVDAEPLNGSWSPTIAAMDSLVYITFDRQSNIDYQFHMYGKYSIDFGASWSNNIFISDTCYAGDVPRLTHTDVGALHLTRQYASNHVQQVHYKRSTDWGLTWIPDIDISTSNWGAQWPRIAAWGNSNVIIGWFDYKYSPYAWTGDILIRRSTDNGQTWLDEQVLTDDHKAKDCTIVAKEGAIYIVYPDEMEGNQETSFDLMFVYSLDGGVTWSVPERLTDAPNLSVYPNLFLYLDDLLLTWEDGRDDTGSGYLREVYFKKNSLLDGISDRDPLIPQQMELSSYPNPFNSSTTITISNLKGGDIRLSIYDIQGREIRIFKGVSMGGDKKVVWDATDASGKKVSSGLYFARASTPRQSQSIRLTYLK